MSRVLILDDMPGAIEHHDGREHVIHYRCPWCASVGVNNPGNPMDTPRSLGFVQHVTLGGKERMALKCDPRDGGCGCVVVCDAEYGGKRWWRVARKGKVG